MTPVIYIIPGNPGNPIFYKSFIKTLKAKTGYNVIINLMPGHTLETMHMKSTLKNAISYHTKQIKKYQNVILIGHSIGCFIGMHIAKRLVNIDKFILLFPTIVHMEKTPGREHMDTIEPIYRFVAPMSDYFPKPFSNWLSNSEYGHNLFHKQIIMNCIGLWHEERESL